MVWMLALAKRSLLLQNGKVGEAWLGLDRQGGVRCSVVRSGRVG